MSERPDLLVKENLVRHLSYKIERLEEIEQAISSGVENLFLESLLVMVVSYIEAALLDTMREYVYARPFEIYELMLDEIKGIKEHEFKGADVKEKGFENYLVDKFLHKVELIDVKGKINELEKITDIGIDLGGELWERILEAIARRNCLIHNDLVANNQYFLRAGNKAEAIKPGKELSISDGYLRERISDICFLLSEIKGELEDNYKDYTNVSAVRRLWNYIFEERFPLVFDTCWETRGDLVVYIGPGTKELEGMMSLRTVCLFTAWMSFFNGMEIKHFSTIFYNNAEGRERYTDKLKFLMDSFENVDFQGFRVKVYEKENI